MMSVCESVVTIIGVGECREQVVGVKADFRGQWVIFILYFQLEANFGYIVILFKGFV